MTSFDRWLESARAKPKRWKQRFALAVSFGITFAIFFVWITTFHIRAGSGNASLAGIATPFEQAGQAGGDAISAIAGKWNEAKDAWNKFRGEVSAGATTTAENPQNPAGTQ